MAFGECAGAFPSGEDGAQSEFAVVEIGETAYKKIAAVIAIQFVARRSADERVVVQTVRDLATKAGRK